MSKRMTNNAGVVIPEGHFPLKLQSPDLRVHTFESSQAFERFLIGCEHELTEIAQHDPAPMETLRYEVSRGCKKCGCWFLAGSWEPKRVLSAESAVLSAPCPVPSARGEARPRWRERVAGFLRAFWWCVAVGSAPRAGDR